MLKDETLSMSECMQSETMSSIDSSKGVCCGVSIQALSYHLQACKETRLSRLQAFVEKLIAHRSKRELSDKKVKEPETPIEALRQIHVIELQVNKCVNKATLLYLTCNVYRPCCSGTFVLNNRKT